MPGGHGDHRRGGSPRSQPVGSGQWAVGSAWFIDIEGEGVDVASALDPWGQYLLSC